MRFDRGGVAGDSVCDTKEHGGWYRAAYAFDAEDLRYWAGALGQPLTPGNAGENLTLGGCDCSNAVIGERWRVGGAVLRVTGPRMPCRVFAGFWEDPHLIKRFTTFGRPGAYLAVAEPGEIRAGDRLEVLSRPEHGVTVADVFAVRMRTRRDLGEHVAAALPDLPQEWADHVASVL